MRSERCQAAWASVEFDQTVKGNHGGAVVVRDTDGKKLTCDQGGDLTVGPGRRTCYTGMLIDGPGQTAHAYAYFIFPDGHAEESDPTASS
jgi:hypothetical protein